MVSTAITLVESQEPVEERKGENPVENQKCVEERKEEKRVERQSPVGGPNSFT